MPALHFRLDRLDHLRVLQGVGDAVPHEAVVGSDAVQHEGFDGLKQATDLKPVGGQYQIFQHILI